MPIPTAQPSIQARVQVTFDYAVHFTWDLFSSENPLLRDVIVSPANNEENPDNARRTRLLVVIDASVNQHTGIAAQVEAYCHHYAAQIELVCAPILLPGGEGVKNDPAHMARIQQAVNDTGLDRHSYIAVIGGGALLDAVGYAAATSHRGVRLLRIPTTTLSQDDSGVGVKNAINAFGKKNFIGTFAPPFAVLNDFRFLETLPTREWRGGIAEAVKVALIKDAEFFTFLESCAPNLAARDMEAMAPMVRRSAQLHVNHICTSGDAFEMGSSRPLDFGHWAAHKMEQLSNYRLSHGDAVAVGLCLDVIYSHEQGWITQNECDRVLQVLAAVGFDLWADELQTQWHDESHPDNIFAGLREFREHLGGRLTIAMLKGIGQGFDVHEIDETVMRRAIERLKIEAAALKKQSTQTRQTTPKLVEVAA